MPLNDIGERGQAQAGRYQATATAGHLCEDGVKEEAWVGTALGCGAALGLSARPRESPEAAPAITGAPVLENCPGPPGRHMLRP